MSPVGQYVTCEPSRFQRSHGNYSDRNQCAGSCIRRSTFDVVATHMPCSMPSASEVARGPSPHRQGDVRACMCVQWLSVLMAGGIGIGGCGPTTASTVVRTGVGTCYPAATYDTLVEGDARDVVHGWRCSP